MSMQDPIADMLTRIRNGQQVGKMAVAMPSSKQKMAIAQIGSSTFLENQHQEVVCTLRDAPLTVVLRLTMDCPILPGSVELHQLVGIGAGWQAHILDHLRQSLSQKTYARPTRLLQQLQQHLQQLGDDAIPPTPRRPVRNK